MSSVAQLGEILCMVKSAWEGSLCEMSVWAEVANPFNWQLIGQVNCRKDLMYVKESALSFAVCCCYCSFSTFSPIVILCSGFCSCVRHLPQPGFFCLSESLYYHFTNHTQGFFWVQCSKYYLLPFYCARYCTNIFWTGRNIFPVIFQIQC